jgi:hypothetical protein
MRGEFEMKYYEIWFYYYDTHDAKNNIETLDERTDYKKEFIFYCKTDKTINTDADMITHLKEAFPVTETFHSDAINCIYPEHYEHMSKWFEISAEEFTSSCGASA